MRATALIAAAALVCGTAAFAQQSTDRSAGHEDQPRAEHQDRSHAGNKLGNDLHRLGDKVRHGVHRLGDKLHAKNDRHDDTRAMGASGENHSRQSRMDSAYADWRSKHDRDEHR